MKEKVSSADIRLRARAALKGNWKRVLGICAADTLIMASYSWLAFRMLNKMLIPVLYGEIGYTFALPMMFWGMLIVLGWSFVAPFYIMGMSKAAHCIVAHEPLDYSLLHLSGKGWFKGVRVIFICAGRAVIFPMLLAWLVGAVLILLYYETQLSFFAEEMCLGTMAIALGVVCCRITEYIPVYQLMVMDERASARELASRSKILMKGNRWRLLCLMGSFIGWIALYGVFQIVGEEMFNPLDERLKIFGFVCSFVSLPLMVYMQTALAVFVQDLAEGNG